MTSEITIEESFLSRQNCAALHGVLATAWLSCFIFWLQFILELELDYVTKS